MTTRRRLREAAAALALSTAIGLFLAALGPFGSFLNGPLWQRALYWTAMSWLGLAVYAPVVGATLRRPGTTRSWATLVLATLLASVVLAAASWSLAHRIWPELHAVEGLTPGVWMLAVLTLAIPQVAAFSLLSARRRKGVDPPCETDPGLLQTAASEVLCLQMEDHYVRVHTATGSRLVLATLGRAIAALGAAPGLKVHRSWWVADKAVSGVVADGRKLRLRLINGVSAPVARSAVPAVRQAGWLAGLDEASDERPATGWGAAQSSSSSS